MAKGKSSRGKEHNPELTKRNKTRRKEKWDRDRVRWKSDEGYQAKQRKRADRLAKKK